MRRDSAAEQISDAKQIARSFGMFVVEKKPDPEVTEYVLYRRTPSGNVRLGRRRSPRAFQILVIQAAGIK